MLRRKKASLSLSINAIVVLILAITMLGLGLGFIRGMFGKVTTMVDDQFAQEPDPSTPTVDNPITLSKDVISFKAGTKETRVIKYAVYCDISAATGCATPAPDITGTGCTIATASAASSILRGQSSVGKIVVDYAGGATGATCTLTTTAGEISTLAKTTSFVIVVK
jgi:hypothetical protein